MKVREGLIKFISPVTPTAERLKAARCEEPESGPLGPNDRLTVLYVLSHDSDKEVAAAAGKSFDEYPVELVLKALDKKLDPLVLTKVVELHNGAEKVLAKAATNPGADERFLGKLASTGPASVVRLLANAPEMLRENPSVIGAIRKNPNTPADVLDSLADGGAAVGQKEAGNEGDIAHEDEEPDEDLTLYQKVQKMDAAQKIKLALTGDKSARDLLIKDSNKMISTSVLKNPRITEEEVARIANSKTASDDIIRQISRQKEWLKNYSIRIGLVMNAKTPLPISIKLLGQLNGKDLEKVAKSRNIPSVLASNAKRILDRKKR